MKRAEADGRLQSCAKASNGGRAFLLFAGCLWIGCAATPATAAPPASHPQQVWFAPEAPSNWPDGRTGIHDYMDMFTPSAPWSKAASHVQVFKFASSEFSGGLPGALNDNQWRQVFSDLRRRGIALAIEWGPLTPEGCGVGIEGFEGAAAAALAARIKTLGGDLEYIAMDEPFSGGSLDVTAHACHWTPQHTAANAQRAIAQMRKVFPKVVVGDIEPIPAAEAPKDWVQRYTAWLDAWKAETGAPLPFFHCDVNWDVDWLATIESMRRVLVAKDVPFGILYDGNPGDMSNLAWIQNAEDHFEGYELRSGVLPDEVVFQTFHHYPVKALPESDPSAMTYLLDRYFRERTKLSVRRNGARVDGMLCDSHGHPIPAAPVRVEQSVVGGPGVPTLYRIAGTVPGPATQGIIQICVNNCAQAEGNADLTFYGYRFTSPTNGFYQNFARGLTGWDINAGGAAPASLVGEPRLRGLLIHANPAQVRTVNSTIFPVKPGAPFTLDVWARVSPVSERNGAFALIYLIGGVEKEIAPRAIIPFAPATLSLGTARTGPEGSYDLPAPVEQPPAGSEGTEFRLQASFPGTATLWPALGTASVADTAPPARSPALAGGGRPRP